jgi:hypothetical protein
VIKPIRITFMGRSKQSNRHRVRSEIDELRNENRRLRELVAHLSKLVLTRIAEAAKPGEKLAAAESSSRVLSQLRSVSAQRSTRRRA